MAKHRGGKLTGEDHRKLMSWARKCSEHVVPLAGAGLDERLIYALRVARDWENAEAAVGAAMKASVGAHAAARESAEAISKAVARSIGHAVATAHMADHSLGAALYALQAVKGAGGRVDREKVWQQKQLENLPPEIVELVRVTMTEKEKSFKI